MIISISNVELSGTLTGDFNDTTTFPKYDLPSTNIVISASMGTDFYLNKGYVNNIKLCNNFANWIA